MTIIDGKGKTIVKDSWKFMCMILIDNKLKSNIMSDYSNMQRFLNKGLFHSKLLEKVVMRRLSFL